MSDPSMTTTLLRVAIVFVLLFATMRVMGRLTGGRRNGRNGRNGRIAPRRRNATRPIAVVDRQALNRGASVAIVELDGRRLAIGITDQNVRLLADLSAPRPDLEIDLRDEPGDDADHAPRSSAGPAGPSLRALADTLRERPAR
jgi:flagellar biogenesis protein FliO